MATVNLIITAIDSTKEGLTSAITGMKSAFDSVSSAFASVSSASSDCSNQVQGHMGHNTQQVGLFQNSLYNLGMEFMMLQWIVQGIAADIVAPFQKGIEVVENFASTVIQTAALITSFQGTDNVAENYKEAKNYAEALQEKLLEMNSTIRMNQQQISSVSLEMLKQGVVLDTNNEKQIEGFRNIANAVATIAESYGNKDIQIRQEVRALMEGQVNMQSQLAQQVDAMVGGKLPQMVAQWKEQGTLIENIGALLVGYSAASDDISTLWTSIKTTTESLLNVVFREGFMPVYETLAGYLKDFNVWLGQHADILGNRIQQAWMVIQGLGESIYNLFEKHTQILSGIVIIVGHIVEGWGLLLYAVFPPLMDRIGSFTRACMESLEMLWSGIKMGWAAMSLDFTAASQNWDEMKAHFAASGKYSAQAFATGFGDEIKARVDAFMALDNVLPKDKKTAQAPVINVPPTQQMRTDIKSVAEALAGAEKAATSFGAAEMNLVQTRFTEDLERQSELLKNYGSTFGDIQAPVKSYLAVIKDVETQQLKMVSDAKNALMTLQNVKIDPKTGLTYFTNETKKALQQLQLDQLNIEKTASTERLKVWQDYYTNLKKVITDKEKELDAAEQALMDNRVKTADALLKVSTAPADTSGQDAATKYWNQIAAFKDRISTDLKSGDSDTAIKDLQALQDEIVKLQDFKGVFVDVMTTVRQYSGTGIFDQQVVENTTTYSDEVVSAAQKTDDLTNVIKAAGDAMETLGQKKISTLQSDMDKMKAAGRDAEQQIKTLRDTLQTLDEQIAKEQRKVTLSLDDKVTSGLVGIKSALESLTSKTYVVNVQYADNYVSTMTNRSTSTTSSQQPNSGDYYESGGNYFWGDGTYAGAIEARAAGGPVQPYATYRINEDGTEWLTMGSQGGYITPAGKTSPGGNGATTINLQGGIQVVVQGGNTSQQTAAAVARQIYPEIKKLARLESSSKAA